MARVMKSLVVLAFVAYIVVMCSPGVDALKCTKCRSIKGDFPIFALCKDDSKGEKGYCCADSNPSSPSDCKPRDTAHGGFACKDSYGKSYPNAYCCFSCS